MKSYSFFAPLCCTALMLLGSGAASSQEMSPPFQSFADSDLDRSGSISIDEARIYHIRLFAALDENQNESLSRTEFISKRLGPEGFGFGAREIHDTKEQRFVSWDVNTDDKLSKVEFLSGLLSEFARVDKNGDSQVDEKEFASKS